MLHDMTDIARRAVEMAARWPCPASDRIHCRFRHHREAARRGRGELLSRPSCFRLAPTSPAMSCSRV